jgi:hypothetical protein
MSQTEASYLERRATAAIELAQRASCPAAVRAHYVMASHYLARLYPENDGDQAKAA